MAPPGWPEERPAERTSPGGVDEVQLDLGRDRAGRGLLDGWTGAPTGEPTGAAGADPAAAALRAAALADALALAAEPPPAELDAVPPPDPGRPPPPLPPAPLLLLGPPAAAAPPPAPARSAPARTFGMGVAVGLLAGVLGLLLARAALG
jgi:hypothetical protein